MNARFEKKLFQFKGSPRFGSGILCAKINLGKETVRRRIIRRNILESGAWLYSREHVLNQQEVQ
jgi:hypothetical protein